MTIDEAIAHCLEVAEQEECFINYPHSDIVVDNLNIESRKRYAAEQKQLAAWLRELKDLREFNGKKTLSSTDSTEIRKSLDPESDSKLRKFYDEHQNENEYKEIQGEAMIPGAGRTPAELVFIKDVQNSFEEQSNDNRSVYEIYATVTKLNHSERNYYTGCAKCHKKMETEVCTYCSNTSKKTILVFAVNIMDASSFLWIDFFGDLAEKFLGMKGEEYEELLKKGTTPEENEGLIAINDRIEYHTFSFIGKVRENVYNETKRHRFSVFRFSEVNVEKRKSMAKMLSNLLK